MLRAHYKTASNRYCNSGTNFEYFEVPKYLSRPWEYCYKRTKFSGKVKKKIINIKSRSVENYNQTINHKHDHF